MERGLTDLHFSNPPVISPVEVQGIIASVNELISIQNRVYRKPTILIATRVTGEVEIPDGVVAVLAPDKPDVLSHVSIRARNSKGSQVERCKPMPIEVKSANIIISDSSRSIFSFKSFATQSIHHGFALKKKKKKNSAADMLFQSRSSPTNEMRLGKILQHKRFLRGRVPAGIKIPMSVAIPFGAFGKVLSEDVNI